MSSEESKHDYSFLANLEFQRIGGSVPANFDCGRQEQNDYIHQHAYDDQKAGTSVTYLVSLHGDMVAFVTLTMDAIRLEDTERPAECRYPQLPALKLAQLGVDKNHSGQGIGQSLISFGINKAKALGKEVGCRFVTLDAKPDLVSWYEDKSGFIKNEKQRKKEGSPISMRIDLQQDSYEEENQ